MGHLPRTQTLSYLLLKSDPKCRDYITLEKHVWKGFWFGLTCLTTIGIRQLCLKQGTSCWEFYMLLTNKNLVYFWEFFFFCRTEIFCSTVYNVIPECTKWEGEEQEKPWPVMSDRRIHSFCWHLTPTTKITSHFGTTGTTTKIKCKIAVH